MNISSFDYFEQIEELDYRGTIFRPIDEEEVYEDAV